MSTPSGYPGNSNDPYGSAGQYPTGGTPDYGQPSSYPPPGQQPGYQQASYPGSDPYAQQYPTGGAAYPAPNAYGQPAYGQQPGYGLPVGPARPGMVTAAAVLAFVVAGLSILVGLFGLLAGSAAAGYIAGLGGVIIVVSLLVLAVGAVYVWAGVLALQGKNTKFLIIVAGIAVVLQLLSMFSDFTPTSLIGLAISAAIIGLLLQQQSKDWFRSRGVSTF